jgi:uncharacterized membrane protein
MELQRLAAIISDVFEAAGVLAMVLGAVVACVYGFRDRRGGARAVASAFRHGLGRGIMLGLEVLVAADILRTIGHNLELRELANLAVLVLIRTFLSFTFEVELEGRWPWQPKRPEREAATRMPPGAH